MSEYHSLSHSKWGCKYHLLFIPKKQRKLFFGKTRKNLLKYFMNYPNKKAVRYLKGISCRIICICVLRFRRNMRCHQLLVLSKEKSAIMTARRFLEKKGIFWENIFEQEAVLFLPLVLSLRL